MNPALRMVLGLVLSVPVSMQAAAPAMAADSFDCSFVRECPTGAACIGYGPQRMVFSHDGGDLWMLSTAEGRIISFDEMPVDSGDLRAFVSAAADVDASAVALLSIFAEGSAILGIHGVFLAPASVTHLGTCVPREG